MYMECFLVAGSVSDVASSLGSVGSDTLLLGVLLDDCCQAGSGGIATSLLDASLGCSVRSEAASLSGLNVSAPVVAALRSGD